jgi:hypothetical protein
MIVNTCLMALGFALVCSAHRIEPHRTHNYQGHPLPVWCLDQRKLDIETCHKYNPGEPACIEEAERQYQLCEDDANGKEN